ncbi:hypothetical protein [Runella sp.]|uniref:hypothetical protein n=1 Tax=Runella sp. TaxID=1960881 RepID=UPI003D14C682
MSAKNNEAKKADEPAKEEIAEAPKPIRCFVIMPFSSPEGYESGHFDRVYRHIIKPACELAGVLPERTDDGLESGYILAKMLKMLTEYELAICDMSAVNANVFYELGVRQSFGKPVTLIKDEKSRRIFDVQGFSSIEYDSNLRIDKVQDAVTNIAQALKETLEKNDNSVNSILPFLEMKVAKKPDQIEISNETAIILNKITEMEKYVLYQDKNINNSIASYNDALFRDIYAIKKRADKIMKNFVDANGRIVSNIDFFIVSNLIKNVLNYRNKYNLLFNNMPKNDFEQFYYIIDTLDKNDLIVDNITDVSFLDILELLSYIRNNYIHKV